MFWAIAIVTAAASVALWVMMAGTSHQAPEAGSVWREWRVLGGRGLVVAVVLGVLINAATFAGFTYLGTITATLTNPASPWIPIALALFGAGSFIGVTLCGRYSDRYRAQLIVIGSAALTGVWLAAVLAAHTLAGLMVFALITGAGAFGVGSTLIATIVQTAAPTAPRIAGAVATATFNVGAVLGPAAAGLVVGGGVHYALCVSFALAGGAALVSRLAG